MFEPCPFCASTRTELEEVDTGAWMVECLDCHATGPIGRSEVAAVGNWNKRELYPGTGRETKFYG